MPPYLSMPYFHLSKLPITTKLALTGFGIALLSGFAFVGVVYYPVVLEHSREYARNFLKEELGPIDQTRDHFSPGVPVRRYFEKQDLPERQIEDAVRTQTEGAKRKAYDIIHPHSFLMPVVFFILCHLMEMTAGSRGFKIGLYATAFVAMMLTVFAPVLVYAAPWLAAPTLASIYVMLLAFSAMTAVPIATMWWGNRGRGGNQEAAGSPSAG